MTTLTKIIVTTLLSLLFFSCNFDINIGPGIAGNGHVVEVTRTINGSFNAIKASEGLDVYVTQSDNESVIVEADENLQDLIITEVVDNVLKIHTKKNIGNATSKKVMVSFKNVSRIASTSGSNVHSTNPITVQNLVLESSSGSNMTLDVSTTSLKCNTSSGSNMILQLNTEILECHSSSGSNIKLTGEAIKITADASSGSNIIAGDLIAESSRANASSGSNITINTSKELIAKATSGGGINYYGNPERVEKSDNPSGSIRKK
ncbi:head GIN domain-containing protein [Confluentibacter citreus]|uniref:head GIN domain-containing protein n=1 Tax=Confluentibacter citreus TaxID=2007307 RepID=UPI000C28C52F|nr:head GIN domain-containing protein [Confluentibacter citreus]